MKRCPSTVIRAQRSGEPGIHNPSHRRCHSCGAGPLASRLWIPGLTPSACPGMTSREVSHDRSPPSS